MLGLRERGRLKGYKRKGRARGWWFFRREEVEELSCDRTYANGRHGYEQARATVRARQPESSGITYSRYRDEGG